MGNRPKSEMKGEKDPRKSKAIMTQEGCTLKIDSLAVLLLLFLPLLSAQITPVFQTEVPFSPLATKEPLERGRVNLQPGSVSPSPSLSPSMEPSEEDEWAPAEAYLYNGNATLLALANCSRAYRLPGLQSVPVGLRPFLRPALDALTNAANFLNMIFQANDLRESSVTEDMEWYHALVRGLLEGDPLIRRALLTFDAQPTAPRPQLVLRASRPSSKSQDILLQDLSSTWELLHPPPPAPDASWFTALKFPELSQQAPSLSKRVLLNDLRTMDTPKWGRGDSYVTNRDGVHWANAPFLECEGGRFLPGWLLTLSTSFYGLKPDLSPEFRGVIRVDVILQSFDVDQCAKGEDWFSDTHQCNRTSMQCEPIRGQGFRLGQYRCRCKEGYYSPAAAAQDINKENGCIANASGFCAPILPVCLPCWPDCLRCEDGSPCRVQEDSYLRAGVLAVQGFFMLLIFISMLVAYQFRRSKRIRASGLLLLETILFGSLLLYFPVFILYFKPSTFRCILLRWVRLLGFAIVYGTVTLKMYRVLKVFLSRTAQRVPYMSSMHLLRMLGVIVLTVSWFLSAWTAGVLQNRDRNIPLLITSTTSNGQGFSLCDLDRWDYMMAIAEFLFLCWGSFLCNAVRTVPSAFHEPRYMGIAIHNELLLSSTFHLLRFIMPSLHPDWMLLLFFTHTHVTITVTLGLLFIPKFLHMSQPFREEIAAEVYEDEVDLRRSGSYLNSSFASSWSEHNLDPDDIRDELKKLYSQLEVHKTKKMAANNPHLQKKRSSRRSLGRSIMKRITEIPESMSRQCSREDKESSLGVGGCSEAGSCKKKALEFSSTKSKDESIKRCVLSLRKSLSTYDYAQDHRPRSGDTKDPSLLDSLMRKKLAKNVSEHSDTESVDSAPLAYKSASAHNLSAENNLFQPEPSKLQKSLSVMTSNKGSSTLHPSKTYSLEDTLVRGRVSTWESNLSTLNVTIRTQTTRALLSESFDKAEVCPWELVDHLPESKTQKHVTYALSQHNDQSTLEEGSTHRPQSYISPWDILPCDPPRDSSTLSGEEMQNKDMRRKGDLHVTVKDGSDSDSESTKPQVPVSSSAPGSPVTRKTRVKEHRVFSYRGPPHSFGLPLKSLVGSGKGSSKDKNKRGTEGKDKTNNALRSNCQEKGTFSLPPLGVANPSMNNVGALKNDNSKDEVHTLIPDISALQKQQTAVLTICPWEVEDAKPCLVKQAAVRASSIDSPERTTKSLENIQADHCSLEKQNKEKQKRQENVYTNICPWETPESEMTRQNSSLANICPWEMEEKTPSMEHKYNLKGSRPTIAILTKNSENISAQTNVNTEVSPWDVTEPPQQTTERQQSGIADVCPWDVEESNPCQVKKDTVKSSLERETQKSPHLNTCIWEMEEPEVATERRKCLHTNICPWETEEPEETTTRQKGVYANICPWEALEQTCLAVPCRDSEKQEEKSTKPTIMITTKDKEVNPPYQTSDKAEVCPWDVPDPCQQVQERLHSSVADVCPWDVVEPEKTQKREESVHVEVHPWRKDENKKSETTEEKVLANICPWEMQENVPSNIRQGKEDSPKPIITTTAKRPVDRNSPSQTSVKGEVCFWGVPDSSQKALKIQQCSVTDVCPWDKIEPEKTTKGQESMHVDICPWDTSEVPSSIGCLKEEVTYPDHTITMTTKTSIMPVKTSLQAEVCPWETAEPYQNITQKQQSSMPEVCPWDVEESNLGQVKQDIVRSSLEEVKEIDKMAQRLESGRAKICPWEVEEPDKTTEGQESMRSDICPWETEDASSLENPGKDRNLMGMTKNISQQSRSTATSKQSSFKADVCPFFPEQPINVADICPWEAEDTKPCLVKQAAIRLSSEEAEPLEATRKTVSDFADIHPHEIEEPEKKTRKQDCIHPDVCPWEIEEPNKMSKTQESVNANICPWETEGPEKMKREYSAREDVCPWETKEPEKINKEYSVREDVCPWETKEPEKINREYSTREDVCPWETKEPEKINREYSTREDVCPWETKEQEKTEKQEGVHDDVCPWETKQITPFMKDETVEPELMTTTTTKQPSVRDMTTGTIIQEKVSQSETGVPDKTIVDEMDSKALASSSEDANSNQPIVSSLGESEGARANLPLARRDALCPWKMQEVKSPIIVDDSTKAIQPWEHEDIADDDDAESAAEAFFFPPDL